MAIGTARQKSSETQTLLQLDEFARKKMGDVGIKVNSGSPEVRGKYLAPCHLEAWVQSERQTLSFGTLGMYP
jgi:hypothetical protein